MINSRIIGLRLLGLIVLGVSFVVGSSRAQAQGWSSPVSDTSPAFVVDGRIALQSFMSLSDGHLQKLSDVLTVLASTEDVRSGKWNRIRGPLAEAKRVNVPATLWFALPNGSYWTVAQGRVAETLSDRPYFPRVLAGGTVVGDLVVSRSTKRNSAIVAVPVRGRDSSIIGVLGASVNLEALAALLRREMGGMPTGLLFYAIDAQPLGALNSDSSLIFTEPMKLGDEGMRRAFAEMLSNQEGVVTYAFRGSRRTVLYRKSPVTGWWYGFGVTQP